MSPRAALRLLLPAALVAILAACGGGGGGASAGATAGASSVTATAAPADASTPADAGAPTPGTALNACEIVTADDVKAAVKADSVAAGTLKQSPTTLSPGRTECAYEGDFGRVLVDLIPEDGVNLYDAARKAYKDAVEIPGLGDGAFTSEGTNRAFINKGAVTVMLGTYVNGAKQADIQQALGKAIVAKL